MNLRQSLKKLLVNSPLKYSERVDGLLRLTLLKSWIAQHQPHPYLSSREELYAFVQETAVHPHPITLLEFGVYQGDSLQTWATLNTHPHSQFIGFDSFEGLPEAWVNLSQTFALGSFSTAGKTPMMTDPRVHFVKGWFQQTLPPFLAQFTPANPLIIHCDADIYPSTLYVLCQLNPYLQAGSIIIFDDFSSMLHDFRAWDDYTRAFARQYEVLSAAGRTYYEHVALRLTNEP
ncbi:MAG: class I SAM-dependent methyltransferase [Ardenticatenaceae bacterium]|nr:class I SAM-dependent methyltransferase [Ardenticatenaceae bacterium]